MAIKWPLLLFYVNNEDIEEIAFHKWQEDFFQYMISHQNTAVNYEENLTCIIDFNQIKNPWQKVKDIFYFI